MKKKKHINIKEQDIKFEKIIKEREFIKNELLPYYPSIEGVGVDTEFKEVSFMTDMREFDRRSNIDTPKVSFTYESCDNSMMILKFTYKIK